MKDAVESLGRVRVQGILLLVIVFIAGGIAGALIDRGTSKRDRRPMKDRLESRVDGPGQPGEFPRFFRDLDLTDSQRDQIRTIFERHRPIIDSLMEDAMPKIHALRDSADAEISALLTPEQRDKFEKLSPRFRFPLGDFRRPFDSGDGDGMRRRRPGPR